MSPPRRYGAGIRAVIRFCRYPSARKSIRDRTTQRGGGDDRARTVGWRASSVPSAWLPGDSGPAALPWALAPGAEVITGASLADMGQWPRRPFDRVPARDARSHRCSLGDSARNCMLTVPIPRPELEPSSTPGLVRLAGTPSARSCRPQVPGRTCSAPSGCGAVGRRGCSSGTGCAEAAEQVICAQATAGVSIGRMTTHHQDMSAWLYTEATTADAEEFAAGYTETAESLLAELREAEDPAPKAGTPHPDPILAATLLATVLERLGYGSECATWRNCYLTGAQELRTGKIEHTEVISAGLAPALAITQLFDSVAIRVDGPRPGASGCRSAGTSPTPMRTTGWSLATALSSTTRPPATRRRT